MKIGTISLNINAPDFNYGAILHSWAFQQYLKKLDYVDYTEIIDYTMPALEGQNLKHPILESFLRLHPRKAIYHIRNYRMYASRYAKFEKFIGKYICKTEKKYTQSTLDKAALDYDCVICESDVIWSPGFCGGHFDKTFFLALDSMQKMKKIAYAPSMSNGDMNAEQENELRELLRYPDIISCRESYEKSILEKYTNKKVEHVLDPVMLLDSENYLEICAGRVVAEDYLLLYLPVGDNEKLRIHAQEYACKHRLKILEISTKLINYNVNGIKCIGDAGVEEFISAIRYANVVFTNSFHAICFSILFKVQFYAFSRAYSGKVEDVCKTFGLEERYFADDNFVEKTGIDYEKVYVMYQGIRERSDNWLNNALLGGGKP